MYMELLAHMNTYTLLQTNIRGYQFQLSQLYCPNLTNMYKELLTHVIRLLILHTGEVIIHEFD